MYIWVFWLLNLFFSPPQLSGHRLRSVATLSVFAISAVVHEYAVTMGFGFFYPVMFCLFAVIGGKTRNHLLYKSPLLSVLAYIIFIKQKTFWCECLYLGLGLKQNCEVDAYAFTLTIQSIKTSANTRSKIKSLSLARLWQPPWIKVRIEVMVGKCPVSAL